MYATPLPRTLRRVQEPLLLDLLTTCQQIIGYNANGSETALNVPVKLSVEWQNRCATLLVLSCRLRLEKGNQFMHLIYSGDDGWLMW